LFLGGRGLRVLAVLGDVAVLEQDSPGDVAPEACVRRRRNSRSCEVLELLAE
jgi:hypothetical protein